MRGRLAISLAGLEVELREILLRDKPFEMLQISEKGTVPVLLTASNEVIDESLEVMFWALRQNDPFDLLLDKTLQQALELIDINDNQFKDQLDLYKYAVRFPEKSALDYRNDCEFFLKILEKQLSQFPFLVGERLTIADIAIFPFIRQFAFVDKHWFDQSEFKAVQVWLKARMQSRDFQSIMQKYPPWNLDKATVTLFPN